MALTLIYTKYQDIHNEDRGLWNNFYKECNDGKYKEAKTLYVDYFKIHKAVKTKRLMANYYNICARNLTYLQSLDEPTFKQDKIKVSTTPPEDITTGQIYFKIEEE